MRDLYGTGGGEPAYTPPVLFPRIRSAPLGDLRFRYIMKQLLLLQEKGELFVTDLLAQPSATRDDVGLALTGQIIDPQSHLHVRSAEDVPPVLLIHKFKIRCIEGRADTIKYKRAVVKDPRGKVLGSKMGVSEDGETWHQQMVRNVDHWRDWESKEAELPFRDAWVCMSQYGKWCRRADRLELQMKYWIYEEPDHLAHLERLKKAEEEERNPTTKRGSGRPKKGDAATAPTI